MHFFYNLVLLGLLHADSPSPYGAWEEQVQCDRVPKCRLCVHHGSCCDAKRDPRGATSTHIEDHTTDMIILTVQLYTRFAMCTSSRSSCVCF